MNAITHEIVYRPARREAGIGVLIMIAGPAGAGKTLSALRLARGLAGPKGIIALADTENKRALFYAKDGPNDRRPNKFDFHHAVLSEPFRPAKFEAAAVAAQQMGAAVWICDSFSHEHNGPGGLLDFHEEELDRMVARIMQREKSASEYEIRDRVNQAAWIAPKGEHKHMLQRFWQLNLHVVLSCQAERKTERRKGKNNKLEIVDIGYQPVCGNDIPYAMVMSFMLSIEAPGVPRIIKPLLPDLVPIIPLEKPLDERTGAAIAAWAGGAPEPGTALEEANNLHTIAGPGPTEPPPQNGHDTQSHPPDDPLPPAPEDYGEAPPPPADDDFPGDRPSRQPETSSAPSEEAIREWADAAVARFGETRTVQEHFALTDNDEYRRRLDYLKHNHKHEYTRLADAAKASYRRNDPKAKHQERMSV